MHSIFERPSDCGGACTFIDVICLICGVWCIMAVQTASCGAGGSDRRGENLVVGVCWGGVAKCESLAIVRASGSWRKLPVAVEVQYGA